MSASEALIHIDIYSHYFKVTKVSPRVMPAIRSFAANYVPLKTVYKRGVGYTQVPDKDKYFFAGTEDRSERRYLRNTYQEFRDVLKRFHFEDQFIEVVYHEPPVGLPLNLKVKSFLGLRDYQEAPHAYLAHPGNPIKAGYEEKGVTDFSHLNVGPDPLYTRFLSLPTGDGKTFTALKAVETENTCCVILIKPAFIDKWVSDLHETYEDITVDDIMVISGDDKKDKEEALLYSNRLSKKSSSDKLKALLELAALQGNKPDWKFTVISNKTFQNWLKLYEKVGKEGLLARGYACTPDELFTWLGVGTLLMDEVHMDFHLNYWSFLYTHVRKSIALSATLFSDDAFIRRMHEVMFPKSQRYEGKLRRKHIQATAVRYRLRDVNGFQSVNPKTGMYSHYLFEESIMKRKDGTLGNYLGLIKARLQDRYFKHYRPNSKPPHKAIIYAASIDMCTCIATFLQEQYPHLKVGRYVEDDPYENLMESDIVVSTIGSAGTGMDIKGLTYVCLTVAVSSTVSNIQGYGRLREFPSGNVDFAFDPMFDFFVCLDDQKHVDYALKKEEILQGRALSVKAVSLGEMV